MDLRGHLDLLLLATLARTGPVHGYALIGALRDSSDGTFDLPEGTVYPALRRLERDELVSSWWDDDAPRRRRIYRLTPAGEAARSTKNREWAHFVRGVQAVLAPLPQAETGTPQGAGRDGDATHKPVKGRTRWAH
jgi:DNA-binding PadR family transcriptional regulator